jgi:membrane protein required for colicin V production
MIIDIVVGLIVLASALISFMRGLIREVLTIAGVVGGILAAVFVGPMLAPTVRDWFGVTEDSKEKLFDIIPMEIVADATTYGVIFIGVVIVLSVASHFISGAAKAVGLGPVDRTLGVVFGIARALILLGLVYLPFHLYMKEDDKKEFFSDSKTHYFIEKTATVMTEYLPESEDVEKSVKDEAGDMFKKKLEEQDLLGGKKDDKPAEEKKPEQGAGYDDAEREKLDKLFNEPAVNPPSVNQ